MKLYNRHINMSIFEELCVIDTNFVAYSIRVEKFVNYYDSSHLLSLPYGIM